MEHQSAEDAQKWDARLDDPLPGQKEEDAAAAELDQLKNIL
jgi:hypothetical protein